MENVNVRPTATVTAQNAIRAKTKSARKKESERERDEWRASDRSVWMTERDAKRESGLAWLDGRRRTSQIEQTRQKQRRQVERRRVVRFAHLPVLTERKRDTVGERARERERARAALTSFAGARKVCALDE